MAVRILIAEHDASVRDHFRNLVAEKCGGEVVGIARDGQEAVQMSMQLSPDIALIAFDLPGMSGLQTCEILTALNPDVLPVLMNGSVMPEHVQLGMRAGARAFISRSDDGSELGPVVADLEGLKKRRESSDVQQWSDPSRFPLVIAVTGAKGGVGKSTIAVNLGVTFARDHPGEVVVVDLYTQFGDVAAMFNVTPKRTIAEMSPIPSELDAEMVDSYMTPHKSGVKILVASNEPLPLDAVPAECLDALITILKRKFRYIILDTPPMLYQNTLPALAYSNVILLIANLFDVTTVADTRQFYNALLNENISLSNVRVVLNRVSRHNRLSIGDIEKIFGSRAATQIPNDSRLVQSVNQGTPLAGTDGKSPFGKAVRQLADEISARSAVPAAGSAR